jgi:hypothetical protein
VQVAFVILILLLTFSRTECPCPKTFDGQEDYDEEAHFNVCDFQPAIIGGKRVLKVRFRRIKQDRRIERPEAAGDGDWAILGEVPGSVFCPLLWYTKFNARVGKRANKRGSMFLDPDMQRPLIYSRLVDQFKAMQRRIGIPDSRLNVLHGLRVEGYNLTKRGLGQDVAVAHGLWKSKAHQRYDRFDMQQVMRIPSVIAGVDAGDDSAPTNEAEEREVRSGRKVTRGGSRVRRLPPSASGSDGDDEEGSDGGSDASSEELEESGQSGETPAAASPGVSTAGLGGVYWGRGPARRSPYDRRRQARSWEPAPSPSSRDESD